MQMGIVECISWLASKCPLALCVAVGVVAIVGVPTVKWRYRLTTALLCILSLGASLYFYISFQISAYYAPDQLHWPLLATAIALFLFSISVTIECASLVIYRSRNMPRIGASISDVNGKLSDPKVRNQWLNQVLRDQQHKYQLRKLEKELKKYNK